MDFLQEKWEEAEGNDATMSDSIENLDMTGIHCWWTSDWPENTIYLWWGDEDYSSIVKAAFLDGCLHIADIYPEKIGEDPATDRQPYANNVIGFTVEKMNITLDDVQAVRYYCIKDEHFTPDDKAEMDEEVMIDRSADMNDAALNTGIIRAAKREFQEKFAFLYLGGDGLLGITLSVDEI